MTQVVRVIVVTCLTGVGIDIYQEYFWYAVVIWCVCVIILGDFIVDLIYKIHGDKPKKTDKEDQLG